MVDMSSVISTIVEESKGGDDVSGYRQIEGVMVTNGDFS
jgi:hypothetical protein